MKRIIGGTIYNTHETTTLAECDHYSDSGTYAGTTALELALNGNLLLHTCSNGQDFYLRDSLDLCSRKEAIFQLDYMTSDAQQTALLIQLGLIKRDEAQS